MTIRNSTTPGRCVAAVLLLCCCCAAVVVLYAHHVRTCLFFVFPSCAVVSPWSWELCMHPPTKILHQFCCVVPPVVTHLQKTHATGRFARASSGASYGPPASPSLLCCCSCATLIMYACLCFEFPSCSISPWSWELCMYRTKIYSTSTSATTAVWSHL